MKKTYILTVMLLVLTVILSGCGSQDSDQASSGSFELSVEDTDTQGSSSGPEAPQVQETAIEVFVPSSMTLSMNDLIEAYKEQSGAGRIVALIILIRRRSVIRSETTQTVIFSSVMIRRFSIS